MIGKMVKCADYTEDCLNVLIDSQFKNIKN